MASGPFPARWSGECAECGERWDEGDEIRYSDADELVGEDCCGYAYAGADS